jgi:8-oxo-dGTP diphosphatase
VNEESLRFCPHCATPLESFIQDSYTRQRCPACKWVHYRNPTVGVAVIVQTEQGLLLGRRRSGGWCIPCGHVEWDETVEQAARREAQEEIGLDVELLDVFAVLSNFHDPEHHTVGIWYRCSVDDLDRASAGGDLKELRLFPLDEIPKLVFPTDRQVVQRLIAERSRPSSD